MLIYVYIEFQKTILNFSRIRKVCASCEMDQCTNSVWYLGKG